MQGIVLSLAALGLLSSSAAGDRFNTEDGVDYFGNDLDNPPRGRMTQDPDGCGQLCDRSSGCKAWTFAQGMMGGGSCYLKTRKGSPKKDRNCISGVSSEEAKSGGGAGGYQCKHGATADSPLQCPCPSTSTKCKLGDWYVCIPSLQDNKKALCAEGIFQAKAKAADDS